MNAFARARRVRLFSEAGEPVRFCDLPVGAAFEFPRLGGLRIGGRYYKTGPSSFGLESGQALWPWLEDSPYVEASP